MVAKGWIMLKSLPVIAFALSVLAAPAWAGSGCGSATTTAHTKDSLEVAQTDQADQTTTQTPKVESSSN
jgi:hypothetical protein